MRHAHARQFLQKFDAKIVAEILETDQDDIATVAGIDPFGDDRGNVIYVVVMTQKEKSFHTLILEGLKMNTASIILLNIPELDSGGENARNCTPAGVQLPVGPLLCNHVDRPGNNINRSSFSQRITTGGRIVLVG